MSALVALLVAGCQLPPTPVLEPAERQQAACELLSQPAPIGQVDRGALASLLAQPEFAHAGDRQAAALEVLLERLRQWLLGLFESSGAFEYAKVARVAVLAVALLVGVISVLTRLRRRRGRQAAAPAEAPSSALVLDEPDQHLARARAVLATDARAAIREGLLALLSSLERRRLARPDRVKTNRELADELPTRGADPALTAQVRGLLGWYDATFYSLLPVDSERARGFLDEVGRLASTGAPG